MSLEPIRTPMDPRRNARAILTRFVLVGMIVATASPAWTLTLDEAIESALASSPEIASLEQEKRALAAAVEQAGVLPNPELQTEIENVGGTGARKSDESAESTIRLVQRLELGGKRGARTQAAAAAVDVATADLELRRRDLLAAVRSAFAAALAAEQRVVLARDLERLAEDALRAVGSAVGAGATSSAERDLARLTVASATRERVHRERQAAVARGALAATWGETTARFHEVSGHLDAAVALPPRDDVVSLRLDEHPTVLRAKAFVAEQDATVSLARASRIPDVTVAAGARHFNDDDDFAAVFSLGAPLPLFDRNRGTIAEAEARLAQAREELRAAEIALSTSLSSAYDQCVAAEEHRALLDGNVLPAAARVLETTTVAHRSGMVPYDDVVDAKRAVYAFRMELIDRLEDRFLAAVELERISGLTLIDASRGEAP
jgi:cobalt-zinc-cadmium efflux system outer membrane protein